MSALMTPPEPIRVDIASLWPEPAPLPSRLLPVEPFYPEMLPTGLRRWGEDIASRMNVPLDFVGIPAMIAAGSLIGKRVGIRPEVNTDWTEVANLWGAIVGPPGAMKSPAVAEAFAPLRHFEAAAAKDYEREKEEYDNAQWFFDAQERQARGSIMARLKDPEDGAVQYDALNLRRELSPPEPPNQKRFIVNDATPEKLGELCRANPMGLMYHRDELLSLFKDLEQEEKATGRAFMMTAWSGQEAYTFDRIGRGTVRIESVNLSVFGTTQPSKLTAYLQNSIRSFDDGMCQRLQLLAWPDCGSKFVDCDRRRDQEARQAAMRCYQSLQCLESEARECQVDPYGGVPYLRFDADAQAAFKAWREKLEAKVRDSDLSPALQSHFAKYRGLAPRLALIWHLASEGYGPVTREAWEMAQLWMTYLTSHAERAYGAIDTDKTDTAARIMRRVTKGDLPPQFTARDVYRNCWSGLKDREGVEHALKMLTDYDWLSADRQLTGGMPKVLYTPNPKALKQTIH